MIKKLITILSAIFLTFFTNSSNISTKTNSNNQSIRNFLNERPNKKANIAPVANDDDFKEFTSPCYNDYEIINETSIELCSEDVTKDQ